MENLRVQISFFQRTEFVNCDCLFRFFAVYSSLYTNDFSALSTLLGCSFETSRLLEVKLWWTIPLATVCRYRKCIQLPENKCSYELRCCLRNQLKACKNNTSSCLRPCMNKMEYIYI